MNFIILMDNEFSRVKYDKDLEIGKFDMDTIHREASGVDGEDREFWDIIDRLEEDAKASEDGTVYYTRKRAYTSAVADEFLRLFGEGFDIYRVGFNLEVVLGLREFLMAMKKSGLMPFNILWVTVIHSEDDTLKLESVWGDDVLERRADFKNFCEQVGPLRLMELPLDYKLTWPLLTAFLDIEFPHTFDARIRCRWDSMPQYRIEKMLGSKPSVSVPPPDGQNFIVILDNDVSSYSFDRTLDENVKRMETLNLPPDVFKHLLQNDDKLRAMGAQLLENILAEKKNVYLIAPDAVLAQMLRAANIEYTRKTGIPWYFFTFYHNDEDTLQLESSPMHKDKPDILDQKVASILLNTNLPYVRRVEIPLDKVITMHYLNELIEEFGPTA